MTCSQLIRTDLPEIQIDFDRFCILHPDGIHLISGWFQRAWDKRLCQGGDCFEAFIFAWFAINGWAACVTQQDEDYKYVDAFKRDETLCNKFSRLIAKPDTPFANSATQFAAFWPIFEVRYFRQKGIKSICLNMIVVKLSNTIWSILHKVKHHSHRSAGKCMKMQGRNHPLIGHIHFLRCTGYVAISSMVRKLRIQKWIRK